MKILFLMLLVVFVVPSYAAVDWGTHCGQVKAVRAWEGGSDLYGLRIELNSTYSGCEGGYFVPHAGENKQYVYSTALTAYTTNIPACIQIARVTDTLTGNLCKLNAISLVKQ